MSSSKIKIMVPVIVLALAAALTACDQGEKTAKKYEPAPSGSAVQAEAPPAPAAEATPPAAVAEAPAPAAPVAEAPAPATPAAAPTPAPVAEAAPPAAVAEAPAAPAAPTAAEAPAPATPPAAAPEAKPPAAVAEAPAATSPAPETPSAAPAPAAEATPPASVAAAPATPAPAEAPPIPTALTPGATSLLPDPALHKAAQEGKKWEDGRWVLPDGSPTYNIERSAENTDAVKMVDWNTYSGWRRYHAECHVCHGPNAEGSSFAPALHDSLKTMDYAKFLQVVASGQIRDVAGTKYIMPALGDNKNVMCYIDDLYVYLRARSTDALPGGRLSADQRSAKPKEAIEAEKSCLGE